MQRVIDGPATTLFTPVPMKAAASLHALPTPAVSRAMATAAKKVPTGPCVCYGIPFAVKRVAVAHTKPVTVSIEPTRASWLVFMHTSDAPDLYGTHADTHERRVDRFSRIQGRIADYVLVYDDGSESRHAIRRKHHVGMYTLGWGQPCTEAVPHEKSWPVHPHHEQTHPSWGFSQTRVVQPGMGAWVYWLWPLRNPHPRKTVVAVRIEPSGRRGDSIVLSGISAGTVKTNPVRWEMRRKALVTLPKGTAFDPALDSGGLLSQMQIDMGQVISAQKQPHYPNGTWARTYNNMLPTWDDRHVLIEYTAHPDACLHLLSGKPIRLADVHRGKGPVAVRPVKPSQQRVNLRVVQKGGRKPVAVKLHVHGASNEYLAPLDRHRIPNDAWFEDYSVDFVHCGMHRCTYIDGDTLMDLPLGKVYVEVSKGFEIRPIRKALTITRATSEVVIEVEKVLPWRERGWVTADTHVHFLSPQSALLEGAAEGINVVNLLASQWGELMTNVGDFDGKTVHGSREAGGDGEYLVRVGTENRQHVMGHISLLGYQGQIIAPMTTGGPDESALGDPIEALLTEWARQCKKQNGVVIIPHFPFPRCEHAATIVSGDADGVEMTSWGNLYGGIDPNSLADWYRYLNCGYFVAAVGGTDKMTANTAVGTVRTYAKVGRSSRFDYESWKKAVRKGNTFVTYGPLMELEVDGKVPGSRMRMSRSGGTVDIGWKLASVTIPMSRVELIVNGEIRESRQVKPWEDSGSWSLKLDRSSWVALLVRGHYKDRPEIVAAHSSPVMITVAGTPFFAAADAMTILEQIEGAMAYMDTVGTRAETKAYKRMRLLLTSVHRELHNRMHRAGHYHEHTAVADHREHHE
ncbi:MAG: hypothetical protein GF331_05680 [Chitinivibrionales bacterium]|nr:hypothetical protein [Chitinivibrionales bacterium]